MEGARVHVEGGEKEYWLTLQSEESVGKIGKWEYVRCAIGEIADRFVPGRLPIRGVLGRGSGVGEIGQLAGVVGKGGAGGRMALIGDGVVCVHVGRRWGGRGEIADVPRHCSPRQRGKDGQQTTLPCAEGVAEAGGYAANSLWALYTASGTAFPCECACMPAFIFAAGSGAYVPCDPPRPFAYHSECPLIPSQN